MSVKFMTWSLKRPSSSVFDEYKTLPAGQPWYSKNYVDGTGVRTDLQGNVLQTFEPKSAPEVSASWSSGAAGFVRMIEKNHERIDALGMHEFMINDDGTIANMGYGQVRYPNGFYYYDQTKLVLNAEETEIERPVPTSLRYLMHNYPNIRWSVQILATTNSSGDRVNPLLDNKSNQDNCIRQTRKIVELYKQRGFPISDIEVDCEKTTTRPGDAEKFRDFLVRVKNEACIPTNTGLRTNLFAMTGDFTPSYYGWHDYRTLASGRDLNGHQAIDEFQLMTYDFSWGGSAPGPSTPLWWLEQVLEHVSNVLPPEKTYIGNAGYGRRWPLSERRMGVTFDYKQLIQAQNGMYVHNDGATSDDGNFYFRDQDFIPQAGFNDPESDYQITQLHVYDFFKSRLAETSPSIAVPSGGDYVTNYSKRQMPKFFGTKLVKTSPDTIEGNVSYSPSTESHNPVPFTYENWTFNMFTSSAARWFYDKGKLDKDGQIIPDTDSCMKEQGKSGENGSLSYSLPLAQSGRHRLIAVVGFPFYGSDSFTATLNGQTIRIGSGIPDWYPFVTNPSYHFWDCGEFDFGTSNTVNINLTNGAQIGGFIVCDEYEQNLSGGTITFPADLQPMKKRGNKKPDGSSEIVDSKFPSMMTLTGELLRRPPRPAIVWEDMFAPHLNGDGFTENTDLTSVGPYYLQANPNSYSSGTGELVHKVGDSNYCISGLSPQGYSKGEWKVKPSSESDSAHAWSTTSSYSQLVLNKKISGSAHIELDCRVSERDRNARYGIRILDQEGSPSTGWAFRLNFQSKQVEFYNFNEPSRNKTAPMSGELASSLGGRFTIKLDRVNGMIHCSVGSRTYLKIDDQIPSSAAYGAYVSSGSIKVYRLNISSLDRFEPSEKVKVYTDGILQETYGEVERNVGTDEFGYLIYTGLPGNLTEAVRAIPSEAEMTDGQAATIEGRSGTIFETEVSPEQWNLDYRNLPLATVNSWRGKKEVTVEMVDPGIWLRNFYIGDSEGFSVAYNSDKIGFIRTSQMVLDHKCKGIALWTLGQEDPSLFSYLPNS
jgi:spore germination protein YaaH